jgi:hypothetical protein
MGFIRDIFTATEHQTIFGGRNPVVLQSKLAFLLCRPGSDEVQCQRFNHRHGTSGRQS